MQSSERRYPASQVKWLLFERKAVFCTVLSSVLSFVYSTVFTRADQPASHPKGFFSEIRPREHKISTESISPHMYSTGAGAYLFGKGYPSPLFQNSKDPSPIFWTD